MEVGKIILLWALDEKRYMTSYCSDSGRSSRTVFIQQNDVRRWTVAYVGGLKAGRQITTDRL